MNTPLQMLFGSLIRVAQGLIAASPTLLVGLLVAAILRFYFGPKRTRQLFGGDTLRSLPQSWAIGMLLPVCSIGVLPILMQLRRSGVKPGAMTAFALSAPLFNPLSLLYGLTLSRPSVILLFALGSLLIVTTLGLLWDRLGHGSGEEGEAGVASEEALIGLRRLGATAMDVARSAVPTLGIALLALMGVAGLAMALPYGALQGSVERDDPTAPLTMLAIAVPVYATPMVAMSQLGMMFQHANSPGAAFTLLILGAGINIATPVWFAKNFGWRSTGIWMASLLMIVAGISYGINEPLAPPGVEPAGHTHAFDVYTNPLSSYHISYWAEAKEAMATQADLAGLMSFAALIVVASLGLLLRVLKVDEIGALSQSSERAPVAGLGRLDVEVPRSVLGATMLIGLIGISVIACYAYYPTPNECLEEIALARAECLSAANSGDAEHALFWLPVWEEWSRRLEVGTFLRHGEVRRYQRMQGYLLRKKLELLEHELEHDPYEPMEVKMVVRNILSTNNRWVKSFRDPA